MLFYKYNIKVALFEKVRYKYVYAIYWRVVELIYYLRTNKYQNAIKLSRYGKKHLKAPRKILS